MERKLYKGLGGGDGTGGPALYLLYLGRQSADGGSPNRCQELCDRIYGSGDRSDKRRGTRQGQQSNRVQLTQVGCRLWDAKGTLLKEHVENCQRQESRFNMWYDISAELGVTLTPATAYSYQFFVMENGASTRVSADVYDAAGICEGDGFCAYQRRTDQ